MDNLTLLRVELSSMLPYKPIVKWTYDGFSQDVVLGEHFLMACVKSGTKPYLRKLSSMTEEERKELQSILPPSLSFTYTTSEELVIYTDSEYDNDHDFSNFVDIQDWLNSHHFDYRHLIEKGLALEAPQGMYKIE